MTDTPPTEEEKAHIRQRLQALEVEHHDLDDVIGRLVSILRRIGCSSSG